LIWHKLSARTSKKSVKTAAEKHIFSKTSPSELFEVLLNPPEQLSIPKITNQETFRLPYDTTGQKFNLVGELKFFILAVFISFLLWFALAIIIEQNIIAPEHIYLMERNAFFLTILIFYFLRLSAWMTNKTDAPKGTHWEIQFPVTRREMVGQRSVGYAKDEAAQVKNDGEPESMISDQ